MDKILGFVGSEALCSKELLYSEVDPDNSLEPWKLLLDRLASRGIDLVYHKRISDNTEPYGYLFMNYDKASYLKIKNKAPDAKKFLIVFESEVVMPENWSSDICSKFDVILSWDEKLISQPKDKFVHFFWPNHLPLSIEPRPFGSRKKDFVMVVSNKMKNHPLELYSERLYTVDWFIKNSPERFDLYGWDWNYGAIGRIKKRIRNLSRFFAGKAPLPVDVSAVYKGVVDSKLRTLSDYKFSFCYENARDIPGYVTEKIFDCFSAGVVPVYLGWGGISKYIPRGCFIDRRNYQSMESLVQHLASFSEEEYCRFISNIADFLNSDSADRFRAKSFVDVVIGVVVD